MVFYSGQNNQSMLAPHGTGSLPPAPRTFAPCSPDMSSTSLPPPTLLAEVHHPGSVERHALDSKWRRCILCRTQLERPKLTHFRASQCLSVQCKYVVDVTAVSKKVNITWGGVRAEWQGHCVRLELRLSRLFFLPSDWSKSTVLTIEWPITTMSSWHYRPSSDLRQIRL